jgi:hypothetical protein
MPNKYFKLTARVSSSNPQAIRPVLENLITQGSVQEVKEEFQVEAGMEGESAKELNRFLLSSLRRVEKRTRLRAEWTSDDGITQRFFDYVLKSTSKSENEINA